MLSIAEIMSKSNGSTKTASAAPAPKSTVADALKAAVEGVSGSTKTASSPVMSDLEQLATKTAEQNKVATEAYVGTLGTAFFHGVVKEAAAYEAAAMKLASDKAAEMAVTAEELEMVRLARENPSAFIEKVAEAAQGSEAVRTKEAQELYEREWREGEALIHKAASAQYENAYRVTTEALSG